MHLKVLCITEHFFIECPSHYCQPLGLKENLHLCYLLLHLSTSCPLYLEILKPGLAYKGTSLLLY